MTPTITRTTTINTIIPVILNDLVLLFAAEFLGVNQFAPLLELPEPEFNGSKLFMNLEFPLVLIYIAFSFFDT